MTNQDDYQKTEVSQDQIGIGNVAPEAAVAAGRGAKAYSWRIIISDSRLWPFLIALLLVIAGLIYYLLRPDIPAAMAGEFNVAVAEFIVVDEEGQVLRSDEGQEVAQWLFGRLDNTFSELDLQQVRYELWPPAYTGQITGESKEEREEAAQELAERIKAHVMIYGVITESQDARSELAMEFYVNSKGFEQGEEITGQHELGQALLIALPFEATQLQSVENPALSARSQAIALLTLGLAHYTTDNFDQALSYFEQAEAIQGWFQNAGKEVLYLLLGNTNSRLASVEKSPEYLAIANEHYETALSINPTYARAKVGQGGVLYVMALGDPNNPSFDTVELDKLDEAEATLQAALTLGDPPESANIETKVDFSLGQIYFVRAQLEGEAWSDQAKAEFEQVVQTYEAGNERIVDIASHAYAHLGRLAWLEGDIDSAASHYTRATELASPYYQGYYPTQLGELYASRGDTELAIEEYQKAIQTAELYGDEENAQKYAQRVNELQTGSIATETPTEAPAPDTPVEQDCNDDSLFISDVTIPDDTIIESGETFLKTWRFQNSGTCTWTSNYQFVFIDNEQMGAPSTVPVSQEVAPGDTVDLSVNFTAPTVPGTYLSSWQLGAPDGTLFGVSAYVQIVVTEQADEPVPTPTPTSTTTPETTATATQTAVAPEQSENNCNNESAFLSDISIPDDSEIAAGESFVKTWRVENSGSCTWSTNYEFVFIEGEQMEAPLTVPLSQEVAPGSPLEISVNFTAPTPPGTYRSIWQLRAPDGTLFETTYYVQIVVTDSTQAAALAGLKTQLFLAGAGGGGGGGGGPECLEAPSNSNSPLIRIGASTCLWNHPLDEKIAVDISAPTGESYSLLFEIKPEGEDSIIVRNNPLTNEQERAGNIYNDQYGVTALELYLGIPDDLLPGVWDVAIKSDSVSASETLLFEDDCSVPPGTNTPTIRADDIANGSGKICLWNFPLDEPISLEFETPEGQTYPTTMQVEWEKEVVTLARLVRTFPPMAKEASLPGTAWSHEEGTTAIRIETSYPAALPVGQWNVIATSANASASGSFVVTNSTSSPATSVLHHDFTPLLTSRFCERYLVGEEIDIWGINYPSNREFPVGFYKREDGDRAILVHGTLITTDNQGNFRTSVVLDSSYSAGVYYAYTVTDPNFDLLPTTREASCFEVQ